MPTLFRTSKNNCLIRLTDERWQHISEEHSELINLRELVLKTINEPERIFEGTSGELLAISSFETGKWLVVVYREQDEDGFIITAFLTRRIRSLEKRVQLWP